jgi:uncharacterized protein YcfL
MHKLALVALVPLALAGCNSVQPASTVAPQLEVSAPVPQQINTLPVEWKVLNKSELKKLVAELDKNQDPNYSVFVLTPQGFQNLSLNLTEMKRYIQEQQEAIKFYKKINRTTGMAMREDAPVVEGYAE